MVELRQPARLAGRRPGHYVHTDRSRLLGPVWLPADPDAAVCAQTDPDLFFPERSEAQRAEQAKRLCATCPLLAECREWALSHPEAATYGIWGGLTERERRTMRRRLAGHGIGEEAA